MGFNHTAVQQLWQHHVAVKQARAILVSNAQCVPEAFGRDQQRGLAFALKQGVGGHGRAHLYAVHHVGTDRFTRR